MDRASDVTSGLPRAEPICGSRLRRCAWCGTPLRVSAVRQARPRRRPCLRERPPRSAHRTRACRQQRRGRQPADTATSGKSCRPKRPVLQTNSPTGPHRPARPWRPTRDLGVCLSSIISARQQRDVEPRRHEALGSPASPPRRAAADEPDGSCFIHGADSPQRHEDTKRKLAAWPGGPDNSFVRAAQQQEAARRDRVFI
jgi:hypothetical protein